MNPRAAIPRSSAKHWMKTLVKEGATIGANATIICGMTIGKYAFIGAGAVVTKDVGDYELVFGNPARQHGYMSEEGSTLTFKAGKAVCGASKKIYKKINNKVTLQ